MKLLRSLDSALIKIQQFILMFSTVAMVGFIIWQVITRYFLKISAPYAEELARLAIVWCIFFGAAIGIRYDDHAKMDVLIKRLPA